MGLERFGLNEYEVKVFHKVHRAHLQALGNSEKPKHDISKIKKIKRNFKEICLEVHYEHEWYKYHLDGTWG